MRHYSGIHDAGMFSLTVMLCDDEDEVAESVECLERVGELERTPTREITSDADFFHRVILPFVE